MKLLFRLLPMFLFLLCACSKKETYPEIFTFNPGKGAFNMEVTIIGRHFDSSMANTSVSFNGVPATVLSVKDTIIKVTVPQNATTGKITVTINGRTVSSVSDFIILSGKWRRKADLPFRFGRAAGMAFSIGNKGYYIAGSDNGPNNDLYEYDPAADQWTRKADCGIHLYGICASMLLNGKIYAGICSFGTTYNTEKQWWEYDPATNQWSRKADFPGTLHSSMVGIGAGNKGYAGLGSGPMAADLRDWWEYDPLSNTWTQKTDIPSTNHFGWLTGFIFNNKIYAGPGSYIPQYPGSNEIWEYDPAGDSWLKKIEYPGKTYFLPSAFIIGSKVYIAGGGTECWEYNFLTNSWKQVAFYGHRQGGVAFSIGNKGYFMTGSDGDSHSHKDLWEFTPDP